jgi:hypothetical protein
MIYVFVFNLFIIDIVVMLRYIPVPWDDALPG